MAYLEEEEEEEEEEEYDDDELTFYLKPFSKPS
jgi:hypothetical protein